MDILEINIPAKQESEDRYVAQRKKELQYIKDMQKYIAAYEYQIKTTNTVTFFTSTHV